MLIKLNKFGTTLTSREEGKEAWTAFMPSLNDVHNDEPIKVIFTGVNTLSPSWGDEFLTPLIRQFADRLILIDTNNPSVVVTLNMLEKIHKVKFIRKEKSV